MPGCLSVRHSLGTSDRVRLIILQHEIAGTEYSLMMFATDDTDVLCLDVDEVCSVLHVMYVCAAACVACCKSQSAELRSSARGCCENELYY